MDRAQELFFEYEPAAVQAAVKYARRVNLNRYGQDEEDAAQEARMKLWVLVRHPRFQSICATPGQHQGLVVKTIQRRLKRIVARQRYLTLPVDEQRLRTVEVRGPGWAEDFFASVLPKAPEPIREYLTDHVLNRKPLTHGSQAIRRRAAHWLRNQLELEYQPARCWWTTMTATWTPSPRPVGR